MTSQTEAVEQGTEREAARTVLLASPIDVDANGIGSLFLRDIIASQPNIVFALHREPPFLMAGSSGLALLFRAASARLRGFQSARLRWFRGRSLRHRAAAIAAAADRAKADCIWLTASSPEMIWIGEKLAGSGRDVRVTVWDTPEYLSGNLHLDSRLHEMLMQGFEALLRQARVVSVIGYAMQERYRHQYGIDSVIIRHGIDAAAMPPSGTRPADQAVRVIFAGSLYSKQEWNSFIEALESVGWTVGGRSVKVHFMGRFPVTGANRPPQVTMLGEKPFAQALQVLSTMDIGYLPYWFDKKHEAVASTSFPGKMSAYAAAGLAVFHHAPSYTEATSFLRQYPFGISCASLVTHDIMSALLRLIQLAGSAECRVARQQAIRDELSRDAMAVRFSKFLCIATDEVGSHVKQSLMSGNQ